MRLVAMLGSCVVSCPLLSLAVKVFHCFWRVKQTKEMKNRCKKNQNRKSLFVVLTKRIAVSEDEKNLLRIMILWGPIHTTREEFEKRSLSSAVSCTVHTNPLQKRSFSKTLFKPEEFENADFSFKCGRKTFVNGAFRKRGRHDNHVT